MQARSPTVAEKYLAGRTDEEIKLKRERFLSFDFDGDAMLNRDELHFMMETNYNK